ncbi:MAG: threonine/serine dehydratase [Acetobacteraceae bacterium]|nr:threonine/serine dehydratase [Acetobacteraceae bacterium]
MTPPAPEDVRAAAARLSGRIRRTPLLAHPLLDEAAGARVLVKPEPLQITGSFKLRGALNAVLRLAPEERARGVVTHSSGNHGQALAAACSMLGVRALVAMPADAPAIKRAATERWGAGILPFDRARTDREALGPRLAAERGAVLIPPYDHPDVIAGQGTAALELLEDAGEEVGLIAAPAGGGGLVAGTALAAAAFGSAARIYAAEPEGWDDTARSLAAGERVANDGTGEGFCDSLLSLRPGELTFAINRARLAGAAVVTRAEVEAAMRFAFLHLKVLAEPGGAVALAALLAGKLPRPERGAVGVILSGGNADPALFAEVLRGG